MGTPELQPQGTGQPMRIKADTMTRNRERITEV